MIVKHIGTDGRVRRVFENVSSINQREGTRVVSVNRKAAAVLDVKTYNFVSYAYEYPIALINLASGELVIREEDDTERG